MDWRTLNSDFPKVADFATCNLLMDWKVFDHIPLNDPVGISVADLAKAVDAEESLVGEWTNLVFVFSRRLRYRRG